MDGIGEDGPVEMGAEMKRFRKVAAPQVALLAMLLSACNCEQTFNKVLPTLQMDDQSLEFGEVAVNSTSLPRTVTLKAITSAAITVSFEIQDDTDGVFSLEDPIPKTVPPNGKVTLSVVFSPKAVKAYAATLVVTSNDPNPDRTVHRISMSGSGESPQIEVTPDHLSFSAVACPPGAMSTRCRDEQTVTLHNVGLVNLTLGVVKIVGPDATTPAPANLTLKQLVSTSTILPGDTLQVVVLWRPHGERPVENSQLGDFTARLEVPSDDPAHPVTYVALAAHADKAEDPHVCLNGLSVTQRKYTANPSTGRPTISTRSVSTGAWADPAHPDQMHGVLPGMTVNFTTLPFTETCTTSGTPPVESCARAVDPVKLQHDPCTYDPQDLPLTIDWRATKKPTTSRTEIAPTDDSGVASANGVLPIDAAGTYVVTVRVTDTLGLFATASITLESPLHDDLLTQLSWTEVNNQTVDMDLHLIVDSGPGVTVPGSFLSNQDCYWQYPTRDWFTDPAADLKPVLLLDDQGTSALAESINLLTAPVGSRFRAVVHQFAGDTALKASLQMLHTGLPVIPTGAADSVIESSQPLGRDKIWIGALIEFTNCPSGCTEGMCCPPTITKLDQYCDFDQDPGGGFSGQAINCTGGASL